MKASEYGGSDTQETSGIQPSPHVMTASEKLRKLYETDPGDPTSGAEIASEIGRA